MRKTYKSATKFFDSRKDFLDLAIVDSEQELPSSSSNETFNPFQLARRHSAIEIDQIGKKVKRAQLQKERTNVKQYASNATMHGVYPIFGQTGMGYRRFLWSIVFIMTFTLFTYNISNRVILYYSYPHSTAIEEQMTFNKTLRFDSGWLVCSHYIVVFSCDVYVFFSVKEKNFSFFCYWKNQWNLKIP